MGYLISHAVGAWRSLVARFHGVEEVARSNRVAPTISQSYGFPIRLNQLFGTCQGTWDLFVSLPLRDMPKSAFHWMKSSFALSFLTLALLLFSFKNDESWVTVVLGFCGVAFAQGYRFSKQDVPFDVQFYAMGVFYLCFYVGAMLVDRSLQDFLLLFVLFVLSIVTFAFGGLAGYIARK